MLEVDSCRLVTAASKEVVSPGTRPAAPKLCLHWLLLNSAGEQYLADHPPVRSCSSCVAVQELQCGCWLWRGRPAWLAARPGRAELCEVACLPSPQETPYLGLSLETKEDWSCREHGWPVYRSIKAAKSRTVRTDLAGASHLASCMDGLRAAELGFQAIRKLCPCICNTCCVLLSNRIRDSHLVKPATVAH